MKKSRKIILAVIALAIILMSFVGGQVYINVPLDENKNVTDDTRIQAIVPTVNYLKEKGAKIVLMAHLGRPKGEKNPEFTLAPVAKYMSKVEGHGTAEVANWNFKVNEKEEQLQAISLNSTINNKTVSNNKIAPGTQGSFQIKLDATGAEVGIDYIVRFENESNKPTNLKFKYENKEYKSLTELQNDLTGTINANDAEKTKIITIDWVWPYETGTTAEQILANDKIDTQNAKSIRNYTFNIVVTGTQVNPNQN